MIDHVLKFPSEQVSFEMAHAAGLTTTGEDGEPHLVRFTHDYGIFVQGQIVQPAQYDNANIMLKAPVVLDGWWVKVRILSDKPMPVEFEPFVTDERPDGLWGIA